MNNIKKIAKNLIKNYKTRNPFEIAKKLKIEIIFSDFENLRGFFKKILKKKYIFINSNLNEFEQMLVYKKEQIEIQAKMMSEALKNVNK